jgi:hypothetical protein
MPTMGWVGLEVDGKRVAVVQGQHLVQEGLAGGAAFQVSCRDPSRELFQDQFTGQVLDQLMEDVVYQRLGLKAADGRHYGQQLLAGSGVPAPEVAPYMEQVGGGEAAALNQKTLLQALEGQQGGVEGAGALGQFVHCMGALFEAGQYGSLLRCEGEIRGVGPLGGRQYLEGVSRPAVSATATLEIGQGGLGPGGKGTQPAEGCHTPGTDGEDPLLETDEAVAPQAGGTDIQGSHMCMDAAHRGPLFADFHLAAPEYGGVGGGAPHIHHQGVLDLRQEAGPGHAGRWPR